MYQYVYYVYLDKDNTCIGKRFSRHAACQLGNSIAGKDNWYIKKKKIDAWAI